MTFVVGEDCINCKHTDCVEVCPVDCFYEGPNFLVIHPDECIDCALCEPECPVDAIFSEDELPEDQAVFLELNAELAEVWIDESPRDQISGITVDGESAVIEVNGPDQPPPVERLSSALAAQVRRIQTDHRRGAASAC